MMSAGRLPCRVCRRARNGDPGRSLHVPSAYLPLLPALCSLDTRSRSSPADFCGEGVKGVRLAQQRVFSKKPTSERQGQWGAFRLGCAQWGAPVHLERAERDRVRTDLEPDRISAGQW
jgi:hypothetical protein